MHRSNPGARGTAGFARRVALTACLAALPQGGPSPRAATARPPIILISLDTLRADRLSCYGHTRPTSPHLDALAERGVRFADTMAQSTTTVLSHRAMLTGRLPTERVDASGESLAARLSAAGYATAAFVDGGYMARRYGHAVGFEVYDDGLEEPSMRPHIVDEHDEEHPYRGLAGVLPSARAWIEAGTDDRPFFLFLHTYDVHCPYAPDPQYRRLFAPDPPPLSLDGVCLREDFQALGLTVETIAWIRSQYDAGIRQADDALGEFFRFLEDSGLRDRTVIIVVSDHGERLGHGREFGHFGFTAPELHVPWIMAGPGVPRGRVISTPAMIVDLLPTILDLAGLEVPGEIAGRSMLPDLRGEKAAASRLRMAERRMCNRNGFLRALIRDDRVLIQNVRSGQPLVLFDLRSDPFGEVDLLEGHPEEAAGLLASWNRLAARLDAGDEKEDSETLDEETLRRLRSLGYIDR